MYFNRYTIETDTHCHTVASDHAYSTVCELAAYAAKLPLRAIAVTDHGPAMEDGAHEWHFANMSVLPPYIEGVRVLHGTELNIVDYSGGVDLPDDRLEQLDWVIASCHDPILPPGTVEQHTQAYLGVADNPYIDVIGHSGTETFRYDYERVIPVFGQKGKLVEINAHSFGSRLGASDNCVAIAKLCKKHGVRIVVNSDAHICYDLGRFEPATEMLASIGFPEELIVNRTLESLADFIAKKRKRSIL
jgi:Histidinol phosphatase and related hydrolases of the PHP family